MKRGPCVSTAGTPFHQSLVFLSVGDEIAECAEEIDLGVYVRIPRFLFQFWALLEAELSRRASKLEPVV